MSKVMENQMVEVFKSREYFTRKDLFDFFHNFEPELNEGTFGWRIYDLKNRNIIKPLKRGLYVISYKPEYKPDISPRLEKIARLLTGKFAEIKHCIWETAWLNEFTQHQASRSTLFIEIEKGFEETLFYELKDAMHSEVFLDPDEKVIDIYIAESNQPVIIKKLITRSPRSKLTDKKTKFYTPALEKILVDVFSDERLFYYLQGSELIHIYENAIARYPINFTRLFSYAQRRDREKEIKQFMINHMFHLVKDIIDD